MKQAPTYPGVSVLTVTRRCDALQRCLDSVAGQDYAGAIEHVIVADDQPQVHHLLRQVTSRAARTVLSIPRQPGDVDGPARLATLKRTKIYEEYVQIGVMARGSHRLRDRMDIAHSCVDLGEWLFPRPLLVAHPFESSYSTNDWERIIVEDAKLSRSITTSGAPTG